MRTSDQSTPQSNADVSGDSTPGRDLREVDQVVIRFAGDSGDGMQLTGGQFTRTSAVMGNDLATFPDFPAEIRAPAGTLPGVSAFQVRFSNFDIHTPGDQPDALVAMNPAALKVHLPELKKGGIVIIDTAKFRPNDLKKAKWESNPLEDGTLDDYRDVQIDLQQLTRETLRESPLDNRAKDRCKNMVALGILYWLYNRDPSSSLAFIDAKFGKKPEIAEANKKAIQAGINYADIAGLFQTSYRVAPATFMEPGEYRNIMGNQALCLGLVAASVKSGLPIFLGSYPITPASDILHQLSGYKHHGVVTFQAEDEIAAMCATVGAAYSGALGVTSTSGPGFALKAEAIGLAVMAELPAVIVNVQRAGPSTGMPTKTEQADLLQVMYGRNGESPVAVVCATTPSDAFDAAYEAVRIALKYMTPVVLLSDGYIANGSEPWRIPSSDDLDPIEVKFAPPGDGIEPFMPYARDPKTLARAWARPGTEGLMHRIGGLEKQDVTGNVNYEPHNHERMTEIRAAKIAGISADIAPAEVLGDDTGDLLVLGWGSTRGAITGAVQRARQAGHNVSGCFLRHLNPFPDNLEQVLRSFRRVIVPELNTGQLAMLVRSKFLIDAEPVTKVQGLPFTSQELEAKIIDILPEREATS